MKKLVRESLFEKFTEDSDPIHDMGIGMDKIINDFFNSIEKDHTKLNLIEKLKITIINNKIDIVEYLLKDIKDINFNNSIFLILAAQHNCISIVSHLIQQGSNIPNQAVVQAAGKGFNDVLEILIDNGANIHAEDELALRTAVKQKKWWAVKLLLQNGADVHIFNDDCLHQAVHNGDRVTVHVLLSFGADPTTENNYVIEMADILGYSEILKMLKKHIK